MYTYMYIMYCSNLSMIMICSDHQLLHVYLQLDKQIYIIYRLYISLYLSLATPGFPKPKTKTSCFLQASDLARLKRAAGVRGDLGVEAPLSGAMVPPVSPQGSSPRMARFSSWGWMDGWWFDPFVGSKEGFDFGKQRLWHMFWSYIYIYVMMTDDEDVCFALCICFWLYRVGIENVSIWS